MNNSLFSKKLHLQLKEGVCRSKVSELGVVSSFLNEIGDLAKHTMFRTNLEGLDDGIDLAQLVLTLLHLELQFLRLALVEAGEAAEGDDRRQSKRRRHLRRMYTFGHSGVGQALAYNCDLRFATSVLRTLVLHAFFVFYFLL